MYKRKETGKTQIVVLVLLFAMIFAGCGKEKAKEAFPQEEKSCLIEEESD